ncbi:hypothetical protein Slala02_38150 [Streptomyces lavendulae subsp. lavendulae]|nr:hypothetical protein Slala02_38150 [Streptomyces lavendulae subsp. lavendulae]
MRAGGEKRAASARSMAFRAAYGSMGMAEPHGCFGGGWGVAYAARSAQQRRTTLRTVSRGRTGEAVPYEAARAGSYTCFT